jgi:hypothetical protein
MSHEELAEEYCVALRPRFPDIRLRFEDHGGCWKFRVQTGVESTKALKQAVEELLIPHIRAGNLISRNLVVGKTDIHVWSHLLTEQRLAHPLLRWDSEGIDEWPKQ